MAKKAGQPFRTVSPYQALYHPSFNPCNLSRAFSRNHMIANVNIHSCRFGRSRRNLRTREGSTSPGGFSSKEKQGKARGNLGGHTSSSRQDRAAVEHPVARRASPSNVFAGNITFGFDE